MDSIKKLEEISLQSEALFNRVFGHQAPQMKFLKKNNQGNYFINNNFVYDFGTDGTANPYDEDMWRDVDMKWILEPDVKFKASYISIRNRKLDFQGTWESGVFRGAYFSGTRSFFESGGVFAGGVYDAPNENFKAMETRFVTGKWTDYKNGILGKANYDSESENTSWVALISVPINWVVKLKGDGGKELSIKVLKKIDNINTDFQFQVLEDSKVFTIKWQTIRENYHNSGFFIKSDSFELLGDAYKINRIDQVSLLKGDYSIKNQDVVDFSKNQNLAKLFSIKGVPLKFKLNVNTSDVQNKIAQLQKSIEDGSLYSELLQIKHFIESGDITGYSDNEFTYLKPVFNNIQGKVIVDKNVLSIMKKINEIIWLLSFNSNIIKESKNETLSIVVNIFKKILQTNKIARNKTNDISSDAGENKEDLTNTSSQIINALK